MNNEIINAVNVLKFEGTVLYPTDTIWGIGITENEAKNGKPWRGQNLLGKALMYVRDDLRDSE